MTKNAANGLLSQSDRPFTTHQIELTGSAAEYIEYLWAVEWSLAENETFTSVNIPYPCVHVVYQPGATGIFGPVKGCFEKTLSGSGFALGARFKSGYFYPFSGLPAHQLVAQLWDMNAVFSKSTDELEQAWSAYSTFRELVPDFSEFLNTAVDQRNVDTEKALLVYTMVKHIEVEDSLLRVDELLSQFQISARQLERLFRDYVGLTPKWVIRLFRLQQLANHIVNKPQIDWAELAQQLGYFDQAHCLKDFKSFTGKTPSLFR